MRESNKALSGDREPADVAPLSQAELAWLERRARHAEIEECGLAADNLWRATAVARAYARVMAERDAGLAILLDAEVNQARQVGILGATLHCMAVNRALVAELDAARAEAAALRAALDALRRPPTAAAASSAAPTSGAAPVRPGGR